MAVAAPTGLAAFNVGGLAIHRLFQLHEGKVISTAYCLRQGHEDQIVQHKTVDESSMISSLTLTYIWGLKSCLVVMTGLGLQLQPVNGNTVFQKITQKALLHNLGCTASVNIWRDSVLNDKLTINERQKSDGTFAMMLDSEVWLSNGWNCCNTSATCHSHVWSWKVKWTLTVRSGTSVSVSNKRNVQTIK